MHAGQYARWERFVPDPRMAFPLLEYPPDFFYLQTICDRTEDGLIDADERAMLAVLMHPFNDDACATSLQ